MANSFGSDSSSPLPLLSSGLATNKYFNGNLKGTHISELVQPPISYGLLSNLVIFASAQKPTTLQLQHRIGDDR